MYVYIYKTTVMYESNGIVGSANSLVMSEFIVGTVKKNDKPHKIVSVTLYLTSHTVL